MSYEQEYDVSLAMITHLDYFARNALIKRSTLLPNEKHVLRCLNDYADDAGGNCYPGQGRISLETGLCRKTISTILGQLKNKNVLSWQPLGKKHRGFATNNYKISLGELQEIQQKLEHSNDNLYSNHCPTSGEVVTQLPNLYGNDYSLGCYSATQPSELYSNCYPSGSVTVTQPNEGLSNDYSQGCVTATHNLSSRSIQIKKEDLDPDPEGAVGSSAIAAAHPPGLEEENLDTPPQSPSPQPPRSKPVLKANRPPRGCSSNAVARSEARMNLDYSGGKKYHPRYMDFVDNEVEAIWDPAKGKTNNAWADAVLKNAEANLKKQNREHNQGAVLRYINNLVKANDWGNLELLLPAKDSENQAVTSSKFDSNLNLELTLHRSFADYQEMLLRAGHKVEIKTACPWYVDFYLDGDVTSPVMYTMTKSLAMETAVKRKLQETAA